MHVKGGDGGDLGRHLSDRKPTIYPTLPYFQFAKNPPTKVMSSVKVVIKVDLYHSLFITLII